MLKNKRSDKFVDALSSRFVSKRLKAVKRLAQKDRETADASSFNLMIHSNCSFSPYTPSLAAYMAFKFGIRLAGILDNYTLEGAAEFSKACRILGVSYSTGVELRADLTIEGVPVGNIAIFGVASRHHEEMQKALQSFRDGQKSNVQKTVAAVNALLGPSGITLDFKRDVLPLIPSAADRVYLSKYVFLALSKKLFDKLGRSGACDFLAERGFAFSEFERRLFADLSNEHYIYDMANFLFECRERFRTEKNYGLMGEIISLGHRYGGFCALELPVKELVHGGETVRIKLKKLASDAKTAGFDGICFDPFAFDESARTDFLDALKACELLPFPLYGVEFPRQELVEGFPDEATENAMTEAAYAVVGSEMCENLTGEGFFRSGLKVSDFSERVALFSKIGKGE